MLTSAIQQLRGELDEKGPGTYYQSRTMIR
jgi:hypothetical protein